MGIFDSIGKKIKAQESGIRVSDLLSLPRDLRRIMNRAIRDQEITVQTAAEQAGVSPVEAQQMLDLLVEKGYLQRTEEEGKTTYNVSYGRTHPKDIPGSLWATLEDKVPE